MRPQTLTRYIFPLIAATIIAMIAAGCSSKRAAVTARPAPKHVNLSMADAPESRRLLTEAEKWLGTPYKYGGTQKGKGVDCSGLVMSLYSDALSIKLPRNSAAQAEFCRNIDKKGLTVGDLVFFAPKSGKVNHVGMYIGDGNMIHASGSRGVMISSLNEPYFVKNYFGCGRVDQYEAMISRSAKTKTKDKKTKNKKGKSPMPDNDPLLSSPATAVEPAMVASTQSVSDGSDIPPATRAMLNQRSKTSASAATAQTSPVVNANGGASPAIDPEISLDELIDQRVDSICSAFFD